LRCSPRGRGSRTATTAAPAPDVDVHALPEEVDSSDKSLYFSEGMLRASLRKEDDAPGTCSACRAIRPAARPPARTRRANTRRANLTRRQYLSKL